MYILWCLLLRRKKNASSHSKLKVALVHVVGCQLVSSSYQSEGGGGWGLIDCLLSSKFLVTAMVTIVHSVIQRL